MKKQIRLCDLVFLGAFLFQTNGFQSLDEVANGRDATLPIDYLAKGSKFHKSLGYQVIRFRAR